MIPSGQAPETPETEKVQCAKCGACVPVCPIFRATGRETLTARGRIHLLAKLTAPESSSEFGDILSKCLLCGACRKACPRGIDIPSIIIAARSETKQYGRNSFKKKLIRQVLAKPGLLKTVTGFTKLIGLSLPTLPKESGLHLRLAGLDVALQLPTRSFVDSQTGPSLSSTPGDAVCYFTGCLANHLAPEIAKASVDLIKMICGQATILPKNQGCCGMAALSAGDREQSQKLAKSNIQAFSSSNTIELPIFTSCSTCFSALRQYPQLFEADPVWQKKAEQFAGRVCEFSSFLMDNRREQSRNSPSFPPSRQLRVFYHDPCHLRFGHLHGPAPYPPITEPPRKLLQTTTGITPAELQNGPQCCGQGGLFHLSHSALSNEIGNALITNFLALHADVVVTTCSGCLLRWKAALLKTDSHVQCHHLAEFIVP